ncbi:uncharacterized protein LOC106757592 isoform X3 [Vigna radiata var. radiata]|uniref:Uncharacterized protein LOC106757592 isoform X3 n=1 Tax=Vigna radiata var. radiata TaxID=3916 RepID=A0A3Q0ETY0_VIGRR|nr:uncharacterized protein LOC106757592 isoform X3 [Vigna radiata var. radiata]
MPGNEVGDRVHNFFGQENLSEGQYHSQAVDGNWPGLSNNLWAGTQRPIGVPFVSNLKNFNQQQSDPEQGDTSSPHLRHGLNLSQTSFRHESGRNLLPNQQSAVNGYMQGQQVFQTRQNEANILGMETESDWHSLSRGIPVLESQGSGLELYKKNLARNDATESPVNFDFFGGQQQMSGRHSAMLQPLPRQQSGITEMHLLQQQAVFNQMHEFQRQQQFHQIEAKQQNSMTPTSSISKQAVGSHSASLSGIPINETSKLIWQPEVLSTNANWLQHGASPVLHGASNGLMLSPEQGQALRLMGLAPNQGDQSLYGVPISGSRGTPNLYSHVQADKPAAPQLSIPHQYSHVHGDKPALQHISAGDSSFSPHQYAAFSDQINTNDGTSVSRPDLQGKSMFGSTSSGISSGLNMENLQQMNSEQRIVPMRDFHGRQELGGSVEMSQDKMLEQTPILQNVATLDPTEEKILFGSDDSLWDGFGRNSGAFNMLDSTDSFSGFPSVQSGSWSALMQSAVAESSSGDIGKQEESSGLSFQNTGRSYGNERPPTIDGSKGQSVWSDNNVPSASNINSRPFLRPDDVNRPNAAENYSGVSGFHQSGSDTLHEQHNRLQSNSSRSMPQFLDRGKWLDCSPQQKQLAEGGHMYGNAANSSGLEKNQQTILFGNGSGDPFNKSNGWDIVKSPPFNRSSNFKVHENENSSQPHHEKAVHEEMGQVPAIWERDSDANSSVGMEHVKSAGNMQVCGEEFGTNGISELPNSGTAWFSQHINKQLPNVDVWRDAESAGSYRRNEISGKYKHHMNKNPLVLESSKNGKVEGETHDLEDSNKKEKSADSLGSNPSHPRAGGMRENSSFDGNDLHSPKLSGQGNRRPLVTRKFQYHPMGDLGVEMEPYGNKRAINSQPMAHQPFGGLKGRDQSYLGQSNYGHSDRNYNEINKGDSISLDTNASKSILPGQMPKKIASFDRSVGNYASQKIILPRGPETESSDGLVAHHQQNQSLLSQGFGLQLAPPTQRLPVVPSRSSIEKDHTAPHMSETRDKDQTWLGTDQTFTSRDPSHGELRSNISSAQGNFFDKASQYDVLGSIPQAFTSGFPFSRVHSHNQSLANFSGQVANTQSANVTFTASVNHTDEYFEKAQTSQSELASAQDMSQLNGLDQDHPRDPGNQILTAEADTQSSVTFSASQHGTVSKVTHNAWTCFSSKQHPNASRFLSPPQQINDHEMITGSQNPVDEGFEKDFNVVSDTDPCAAYSNSLVKDISVQQTLPENDITTEEAAGASHLKEPVGKHTFDATQPSPAATPRDIEAFGRSLRANIVLNHNISLLDQVQPTRNGEVDPSNRDVKRLKVSDNVVDKQLVDSKCGQQMSHGYDNVVKDGTGNNSMLSPNPNMLSFSTKPLDGQDTNASSQEEVGYGKKTEVADSNKGASVKSDYSLVNPQMAPSWFERYGTYKNGKMLPMYNVQKMTAAKIIDQPFVVPNQSIEQTHNVSEAQLSNPRESPMSLSVANKPVDSQLSTPAIEPELVFVRPKKRKTATSELIPWHEEILEGSERLRDISTAELDWARSANRLIEKVEGSVEVVEDLSAVVKSKRRLVLTTQLMQQLLGPPPASVLVADVKLHHESMVYSVARLALGEACSSISWSRCDTLLAPGSKNLLHEKCKSSDKIDQYILKVTDFVGRTRKLEDDILRLNSKASILDLRLECQDLERYSVINRFAKFHGRGQNDGVEASSSSDANTNAQKSFPLKYVTAVPLPRNLPDRMMRCFP